VLGLQCEVSREKRELCAWLKTEVAALPIAALLLEDAKQTEAVKVVISYNDINVGSPMLLPGTNPHERKDGGAALATRCASFLYFMNSAAATIKWQRVSVICPRLVERRRLTKADIATSLRKGAYRSVPDSAALGGSPRVRSRMP